MCKECIERIERKKMEAKKEENKFAVTVGFTEKEITVAKENISVNATVTKKHIHINNKFIFRSTNSKQTIKRWRTVLLCLLRLVDEIEKVMDLKGGE